VDGTPNGILQTSHAPSQLSDRNLSIPTASPLDSIYKWKFNWWYLSKMGFRKWNTQNTVLFIKWSYPLKCLQCDGVVVEEISVSSQLICKPQKNVSQHLKVENVSSTITVSCSSQVHDHLATGTEWKWVVYWRSCHILFGYLFRCVRFGFWMNFLPMRELCVLFFEYDWAFLTLCATSVVKEIKKFENPSRNFRCQDIGRRTSTKEVAMVKDFYYLQSIYNFLRLF